MFYVYLLNSIKDQRTYIGSTSKSVEERLKEHNEGKNEWTRRHRPFKLTYYESFLCKSCALHREKFLKSGFGNKFVKILTENIAHGNGV